MDTTQQSQVFFIISSIGFIILWAFVAVLIYYAIRATRAFNRIMDKVESDIDKIGDTTKEMLEDVRDSTIFHFLFKKKKRTKK